MTACTDPAHRLLHVAPVPCHGCGGWLDRDGTVMDRATTMQRYPFMAGQIAATPAAALPDYAGPTRGDRFFEINRLIGALARTGLALIFSGLALALVIFLLVKAL